MLPRNQNAKVNKEKRFTYSYLLIIPYHCTPYAKLCNLPTSVHDHLHTYNLHLT